MVACRTVPTRDGSGSVAPACWVAEVLPYVVHTIPQKELRNQVGDILRRVEAGETFTVTVAGRPVAELRPARRRRWVSGPTLAEIWQGPPPGSWDDDLAGLGAELTDPFDR